MSSTGPSLPCPLRSVAGDETKAVSDHGIYSSDRHAGLLLAQMNKMRLHSDFCDVRLLVGGQVFGVHKLVLAASGPYFAALFSGGMSEAHEEEVCIAGVEADVFEILLEFIYTAQDLKEKCFRVCASDECTNLSERAREFPFASCAQMFKLAKLK
ncbi:Actin-binding protein IPP [Anabarilius grahami]|uniref:Actin-binding protein IPP n=1 Tax=Anabarilius grahami TaxID=495550 RepID=A0A3N0XPT5_ANAGA|nr:Actin-binding protein IPP [Anabarilius grahami]